MTEIKSLVVADSRWLLTQDCEDHEPGEIVTVKGDAWIGSFKECKGCEHGVSTFLDPAPDHARGVPLRTTEFWSRYAPAPGCGFEAIEDQEPEIGEVWLWASTELTDVKFLLVAATTDKCIVLASEDDCGYPPGSTIPLKGRWEHARCIQRPGELDPVPPTEVGYVLRGMEEDVQHDCARCGPDVHSSKDSLCDNCDGPVWTAPRAAAAPPSNVTPIIRREVSQDGRNWCNYAMLMDADPFRSYPHRREVSMIGGCEQVLEKHPPRRPSPGRAETAGDLAGAALLAGHLSEPGRTP